MSLMEACPVCLRRTWLLTRLAGHLDQHRDRWGELLTLDDQELIAAVSGTQRESLEHEYADYWVEPSRSAIAHACLDVVCPCRAWYPARLRELDTPPAVLHVANDVLRLKDLLKGPVVAIVGSRAPSAYGSDTAAELGRGLAAAGVTVLSGMARGIDTHAHRGALSVNGPTVAVLPGGADRPYPPRSRTLHQQIVRQCAAVSEFAPGTEPRRWMFPARNRLIAALADMTVIVEARPESGALITANFADSLGRRVAAVPGRINSPLARGPHGLLRHGAALIDGCEAVLDELFGAGGRRTPVQQLEVTQTQHAILDALAEGRDTTTALRRASLTIDDGLAALADLELAGLVRRGRNGEYTVPVGWRTPEGGPGEGRAPDNLARR
jgi:DNA processing protein